MEIEITTMDEEHLAAVMEIERYSFTAPWSRNLFRHELSIPIARSYVAIIPEEDGKRVVGYMCLWTIHDQCNILKLACHPRYRRQGIGRMLLKQGLTGAWEQGARIASLEVRPSNTEALAFYGACGFVPVGVRKGYYQETHEDAVIMELNLVEHIGSKDATRGAAWLDS